MNRNDWTRGERNVFLATYEDAKKAGLVRASQYKIVKYGELISELNLDSAEVFLENVSAIEYIRNNIAYMKEQDYLIPNGKKMVFGLEETQIVDALWPPAYDSAPRKETGEEDTSIAIGKDGLFWEFATLLKTIPFDKSITEMIQRLQEPIDMDLAKEKVEQWTNKYGLLFNHAVASHYDLPNGLKEPLQKADLLYHLLQTRLEGVSYFMSVNAIVHLSDFCSWLLFASYLYKIDNADIDELKKMERTVRIEYHASSKSKKNNFKRKLEMIQKELEAVERSKEELSEGYLAFVRKIRGDSVLREVCTSNKEEDLYVNQVLVTERGYDRIKEHATHDLINYISKWISLIIPTYEMTMKEENTPRTLVGKYSCSSLFGLMMLEQFSALMNKGSYYRICRNPDCYKKGFDTKGRRTDAIYCSVECQIRAGKKRARLRLKNREK